MDGSERSNQEQLTGYRNVYVIQTSELSLRWSCLKKTFKMAAVTQRK